MKLKELLLNIMQSGTQFDPWEGRLPIFPPVYLFPPPHHHHFIPLQTHCCASLFRVLSFLYYQVTEWYCPFPHKLNSFLTSLMPRFNTRSLLYRCSKGHVILRYLPTYTDCWPVFLLENRKHWNHGLWSLLSLPQIPPTATTQRPEQGVSEIHTEPSIPDVLCTCDACLVIKHQSHQLSTYYHQLLIETTDPLSALLICFCFISHQGTSTQGVIYLV